MGRDPFSIIAHLAAHTKKLIFATGIANIYARDPMAMNAIHNTLSELAPGRFVLSLGVSHAPLVKDIRGHAYQKPVSTMRTYLDAMHNSLYMGPVAHTAWAREVLGPQALLCSEQAVLLQRTADEARRIARAHTATYTALDNYKNNLKQFGFVDADFENSGSDKLVDAVVAWGDEKALTARIEAHWQAGANHVCIQALGASAEHGPDLAALELLAPLTR